MSAARRDGFPTSTPAGPRTDGGPRRREGDETPRGRSAGSPSPRRNPGAPSAHQRAAASPETALAFGGRDSDSAAAPLGPGAATVLAGRRSDLRRIVVVGVGGGGAPSSPPPSYVPGLDVDLAIASAALDSIDGESGIASFLSPPPGGGGGAPRRVSVCALPDDVSRNNHPLSLHAMTDMLIEACSSVGDVRIVVVGVSPGAVPAGPVACAVARAFPLYSRKTKGAEDGDGGAERREVRVYLLDGVGAAVVDADSVRAAAAASDAVRLAGRLVDAPAAELTTDAFAVECRRLAEELGDAVTITEIAGEYLLKWGYGGVHGVGRAAARPPRLVVMTYDPPGDSAPPETVALVGKGITYDTGGLSLKSKDGMPGMKRDMAGAAGMLGGFVAAVRLGARQRIHLILCLAENAIGPDAFRNDDILTMYSGKTVEVNNCDAEGRLVLADGVAHATRHFQGLDLVVDLATLTGSQKVATGKRHAGVLANSAELEARAVRAGLRSGDLCFPLLYAPELLMPEFKSEVADMKNSVKDRGNAPSSCAGHFIEAHLGEAYRGGWLHIDMGSGPSKFGERGTGYGVGLILSLLEAPGFR